MTGRILRKGDVLALVLSEGGRQGGMLTPGGQMFFNGRMCGRR